MSLIRAQIVQQVRQADPTRDYCVNDVYHEVGTGIVWGDPDYQNHAQELLALFAGGAATTGGLFQLYANRGVTVKVYDMADAKPRVPRAVKIHVPTTWESANLAPRDLACCLSFYAHNPGMKHERGRIYIGPWKQNDVFETVQPTFRDMLLDLGHGLFDIGGQNVAHVVHSPSKQINTVVANYWVNDLWDHMSSRQEREMARSTLAP